MRVARFEGGVPCGELVVDGAAQTLLRQSKAVLRGQPLVNGGGGVAFG